MKRYPHTGILLTILLTIVSISSCSKEPPDKFERAARFVKYQCTERYFTEVDPTFTMLEGKHKPSDWLNYFFSVLSTRNWVTEDDEYAEYMREPLLPKGISLQPSSINHDVSTAQLVILADDQKNKIFVKGYDSTKTQVVFNDEWDFPILD